MNNKSKANIGNIVTIVDNAPSKHKGQTGKVVDIRKVNSGVRRYVVELAGGISKAFNARFIEVKQAIMEIAPDVSVRILRRDSRYAGEIGKVITNDKGKWIVEMSDGQRRKFSKGQLEIAA